MILAIIQALLALALGWVAIRMGNYPPTTDQHRRRYVTGFLLFGGLLFIMNVVQAFQGEKKDAASANSMNAISGNQTNLDKTVKVRIGALESNLSSALTQQRNIEMMFATNTAYDPNLREKVIASHEQVDDINLQADDLKLWLDSLNGRLSDREALEKIEHEKQLKQNRLAYQSGLHYFDYAANSLKNMLTKIAKIKGDKIEGLFNGLPTVNDDVNCKLGSLKLQNTSGWSFEFVWNGDNAMRIFGEGTFLLAINGNGSAETKIPGLPADDFQLSTNNYRQPLDERLRLMIAFMEKSSKK